MNIQQILVPIDFSSGSQDIVRKAASLAEKLGADLVLLYVAEIPGGIDRHAVIHPVPGDPGMSVIDYYRQKAEDGFAAARAIAGNAQTLLRDGQPSACILQAAAELSVDLIVMGSHGRDGLRRLVLGSVAERVLRGARCPVMVIRHEEEA